ncbi:hypothetical protein SP5_067_00380 [Sphingomonas parapaucimobilis NBRC 15100]|uniref:Uncharacterized protein n=1 Tax=Sphingomonas parapaucimobilis NBRC 15100 TaxID=1219049 RepID=A0A0A1W834_9SPHN|nr:hypothetical protein SP5_067_00380 [Sphingomonas parapaucimobilis NBRC 15100]
MVPVAAGVGVAGAIGAAWPGAAGAVWAGAGCIGVVCGAVWAMAALAPVRAVADTRMAKVFNIKSILPFFWRRSGIASRRMVKGRPAVPEAKRPSCRE